MSLSLEKVKETARNHLYINSSADSQNMQIKKSVLMMAICFKTEKEEKIYTLPREIISGYNIAEIPSVDRFMSQWTYILAALRVK